MPRRRSFSLLFALALPLAAQRTRDTVAWVEVTGPATEVVAGRSLMLRAQIYNEAGARLPSVRPAWSSSDSDVAWVDENGAVVGRKPGFAYIEARDPRSGASGRLQVQVSPARIEIRPSDITMETGERVTLTARALDADNAPIEGVRFRWTAGLAGIVRVEDATVIGVSEGATTLSALIDAGPRPLGFLATAQVRVRRRADYKLKRIAFADDTQNSVTVVSAPRTVAAGDSVTASVANLANGGQALLLWRSNQFRTLAQVGQYLPDADGTVAHFYEHAVNDNGDVAVRVSFVAEWCSQSILIFRAANQWKPELAVSKSCSYGMSYRAFGGNGDLGYMQGPSIYLRRANGTTAEIARIGGSLPKAGRVINLWSPNVGPFGGVVFRAAGPDGDAFFTFSKDNQVQPLLARGDSVGANSMSQFDNLPVEASAGEWVVRVGGSDWAGIARGKAGSWALPISTRQDGRVNWVHGGGFAGLLDARGNNIFFVGNTRPDNLPRLMRWDGTTLEVIAPADWADTVFVSAGTSGGAIFVGSPLPTRPEVALFAAGAKTPVPILDSRTALPGAALLGFSPPSLARAAEPGAVLLRGGSEFLLKATSSGITPLLTPASPNAAGKRLSQILASSSNRNGDALVCGAAGNTQALYLLRAGQITAVSESHNTEKYRGPLDSPIWGFGCWSNDYFAINMRGQIAAFTNANSWQLLLWDSTSSNPVKVFRQNEPAPGGGLFNWPGVVSIDENGSVFFTCSLLDGRNGLFLYDKGKLQRLLIAGENAPDGRRVNGLNNVVAAGTRAYVRMDTSTGTTNVAEVREYDNGQWRTVLAAGETVASKRVNWFYGGELSANSRGEVAAMVTTPSGVGLVVRRSGDKDRVAAIASEKGPDGEWFLSIHSVALSDQGDLFFTALAWVNGRERLGLYQATPQ